MILDKLERRIIDISFKNKLGHIGSCITTVHFLKHTYDTKEKGADVVLGNSHAALALWVVLEDLGLCDADKMREKYGTHASRDLKHGVNVSGGSLGQAETVALGMALGDRKKNVYLITSDGACAEGSVWEVLRIAAEQKLENLRVGVIANGYGGYAKIDTDYLDNRLNSFYPCFVVRENMFKFPDWIQGLAGHYVVMDEKMYKEVTQ